tara:strand:- start:365 stop:532 length:168 start_codon:yes stop_codon:yes gene_type:complete
MKRDPELHLNYLPMKKQERRMSFFWAPDQMFFFLVKSKNFQGTFPDGLKFNPLHL